MKDNFDVVLYIMVLVLFALVLVKDSLATPAIGIPVYEKCDKVVVKVIIQQPESSSYERQPSLPGGCQKDIGHEFIDGAGSNLADGKSVLSNPALMQWRINNVY